MLEYGAVVNKEAIHGYFRNVNIDSYTMKYLLKKEGEMLSILSMMERSRLDTYVNPTMDVIISTLMHTERVFATGRMIDQFLVL